MLGPPKGISRTPERAPSDVLADVLGLGLVRNARYKRIEARAPWGFRKGAKPRATFYLVARGSALLEVVGETDVRLAAGDVAFLPHGTPHVLRDAKTSPAALAGAGRARPGVALRRIGGQGAPASLLVCFFERAAGRAPALLSALPRLAVLAAADAGIEPWIRATIQLILAESATPSPASALVLQRLGDVLFVQALRALGRRGPAGDAVPDPIVCEALALMQSDISAAWTVTALGRRVGLSRSSFADRFTRVVGEPPLQYLARCRLARAAELLRDGADSVATIAHHVGYESVPSFSRTFKRWHGESPAAFRRSAIEGSPAAGARR